ncbi:CSC1-like protein ERD4 [Camellia lanceoleosa]|uniref:CSC1-like protein ERD4 n=1 Tax=Camellia lanceoleosa TaxID=1840588 RepID=A0ACC0FQJ0_9ERIC|nr:CSC1-like protein ERD4 [Camellia lanceoleosa]
MGLVVMGPEDGLATKVAADAQGIPFGLTNGLDIDQRSGVVYFTDSSWRYRRSDQKCGQTTYGSTYFLVGLPPLSSCSEIDQTRLRFLFQKELQTSDVGSLRRKIVPKKVAEDYLPILKEKEAFVISMDDMDGLHAWSFKFRGKLLNVREASHKQIMENAEIQSIKQILGLQHGKQYDSVKTLRYSHLIIMTDQHCLCYRFFALWYLPENSVKSADTMSKGAFNDFDKLSMGHVKENSDNGCGHCDSHLLGFIVAYYLLWKAYNHVSDLRAAALMSPKVRAEQFSLVVRDIPPPPQGQTRKEQVDSYFQTIYPDTFYRSAMVTNNKEVNTIWEELEGYKKKLARAEAIYAEEKHEGIRPTNKIGFLGLIGKKVDSIEYYSEKINELIPKLEAEQKATLKEKQ